MMKKKQSIIALVLAAIVTVLLGWTMIKGWGPTGTGSMKNINLGLDLSGGVSITYQAVKDNPTDEEMSDTRYKLEQRAQQCWTMRPPNRSWLQAIPRWTAERYGYRTKTGGFAVSSAFIS